MIFSYSIQYTALKQPPRLPRPKPYEPKRRNSHTGLLLCIFQIFRHGYHEETCNVYILLLLYGSFLQYARICFSFKYTKHNSHFSRFKSQHIRRVKEIHKYFL